MYEAMLLQNLAAESDHRTTASDEVWWSQIIGDHAIVDEAFHWSLEDAGIEPRMKDSENTVYAVEIRFEVCPLCMGRGKHVNPSIDAHGLTREDFDEDPDFEESYFRGDYDVRCNLCGGEKVVPVPLDRGVAMAIDQVAHERWSYRQEQLAEMRFGA